jgi:hypothetical protein
MFGRTLQLSAGRHELWRREHAALSGLNLGMSGIMEKLHSLQIDD